MIRSYSSLLVMVQFCALGGLLLTGPLVPTSPLLQGLAILSGAVGLWAVVSMDRQTLQVLPEPRKTGQLVTTGPYRVVRHPMYTAVLGYALALTVDAFSMWRLGVWIVLVVDLLAKLTYEEGLLRERFSDYEEYGKGTWRLVPFLY